MKVEVRKKFRRNKTCRKEFCICGSYDKSLKYKICLYTCSICFLILTVLNVNCGAEFETHKINDVSRTMLAQICDMYTFMICMRCFNLLNICKSMFLIKKSNLSEIGKHYFNKKMLLVCIIQSAHYYRYL